MKAVAPRIERLYESEARRWRAAWERFEDDLFRPLLDDEIEAYIDCEDARADEAVCQRLDHIIEAWEQEAGLPQDDDAQRAFIEGVDQALLPDGLDRPDLTRWPDGMPEAPPHDAGAEAKMWKICRRDQGNGEDERLAAGYVLTQLAMARVARIYHRPRFQG